MTPTRLLLTAVILAVIGLAIALPSVDRAEILVFLGVAVVFAATAMLLAASRRD